jgi:hypothetical protein
MQSPVFGLLCGTLSEDAVLENVTVSGSEFIISGDIYPQDYTLGALIGAGGKGGIDASGVKVSLAEGAEAKLSFVRDEATGEITLTFLN